jgi:sugar phosphate isomerase/epimerase
MNHVFPLTIISDEVSQDLDQVVSFAKEFGLGGIEVRSMFGRPFKDLTPAEIRRIRNQLDNEGLKAVACDTPVFKCNLDRMGEVAQHHDIFKRSVEKAVEWNCDLIRVFTFFRKSTVSTTQEIEAAAREFSKLLEAIKGTNLRIGVENEYSAIVGTGAESKEFLQFVTSPLVGLVWDPCNVLFVPRAGDPVKDDYPLVADRVLHVHLKDAKQEDGKLPEHCVELGTGSLDFPLQLRLLKEVGYRGWLSLETHWRSVPMSPQTAHLPSGYHFSLNAEPASRVCMNRLIAMLENI